MPAMSDPTMIVCVDGPTRGRLRAVTDGSMTRFHAYEMMNVTQLTWRDADDIITPALTYHVHNISFWSFCIRIASIHENAIDIDPYDVITALFNESARQATYRVDENV
jgi:hypothetical protein